MLDAPARQTRDGPPPFLFAQEKLFRTNQVPDAAALVCVRHACEPVVKLAIHCRGLIYQHGSARQQIENRPRNPGQWRVKLPTRKHRDATCHHRLLNDFFRTRNAPAGQPCVNGSEHVFGNRRFRERQNLRFIDRSGRPLRRRIELPYRFDFVAEELDAHRAICLGRINVQNAAAQRMLARHLDHIHRNVADRVQVAR